MVMINRQQQKRHKSLHLTPLSTNISHQNMLLGFKKLKISLGAIELTEKIQTKKERMG